MDVSSNGFSYDCFGKLVWDNLKRSYLNIAIETSKDDGQDIVKT